jgi:hypothetical protein
MKSQSIRNNLIFPNKAEHHNERPKETESKLRNLMGKELKIGSDKIKNIGIDRAQRLGP